MADRFEKRAFDVFNEKFEKALPIYNNNHKATFHAINAQIEKVAEFSVFSSYDSFKNSRSRRNKKKK